MKKIIIILFILIIVIISILVLSLNKKTSLDNEIYNDMVHIEGGLFLMGADDIDNSTKPVHKVWIDSFYMGRFEVTNKEYGEFIADGGYNKEEFWTHDGWKRMIKEKKVTKPKLWDYEPYGHLPNKPVVGVSWYESIAYCNWKSIKYNLTPFYNKDNTYNWKGNGYRLPTEGEWEYAAGGKEHYKWSLSNTFDESQYAFKLIIPADKDDYAPNSYGLYSMCGSVWEWCNDWFDYSYQNPSSEITRNPIGPDIAEAKVIKGSSYSYHHATPTYFRVAYRTFDWIDDAHPYGGGGFRLILPSH